MKALMDNDLFAIDQAHIWHPYTQHKVSASPLLVKKAQGEFIYVVDEFGQEKKLIDGISSWWVNIHGHCNPYIANAIKKQLDTHEQVIFAGLTHEPAIQLIEKLLPILPVADINSDSFNQRFLSKAFFSDNGSTAVEVGIKMAIQYFYNQGNHKRNRIIAFKDSYHGDTVGAMSSSGSAIFHEAFKSLVFPVHFVSSPSADGHNSHPNLSAANKKLLKLEAQEIAEQEALGDICELLNKYPDEICAIVIEPLVQGAGGMKFHRNQFLQKLRKLTSDFGILLIADEVFTGFGRTGSDFACKQASIVPDIICLSKAITGGFMPMGLTVTTEQVYSAFHSDSRLKTFFHGHSYTGNSLSCAAAVASLELYQRENRLEDVKYINLRMRGELLGDELYNHPLIKDIRILGALAVIEFQSSAQDGYLSEIGPLLTKKFLERNILLRPLGNILYFLPPYTISVESLEYTLNSIRQNILEGF